ncbi:MAG: DUF2341 domain-containing protein, partial [Methanocellales archaeon]|nr:DUF2341 domain-containing protein [Methanocellales archaeon]
MEKIIRIFCTIALVSAIIASSAMPALATTQVNATKSAARAFRGEIIANPPTAAAAAANVPNNTFGSTSNITEDDVIFQCDFNDASNWYNPSWNYRKLITIDHTKVDNVDTPSTTYANFPVLINISSDSGLASKAQSDGDDILFTSSDGTTKLNHEIELYNSSTGELVAWVNVTLTKDSSDATNDTLYMYYGNSGASSQQNAAAVWNPNYKAVWHLKEATGSTSADSTSNKNNATPLQSPTQTSAKIDGGLTFNGVGMEDNVNSAFGLGTTSATMEVWAYLSDTSRKGAFLKIGGNGSEGGVAPGDGYAFGVGAQGGDPLSYDFEHSGNSIVVLYEALRWIPTGATYTAGWHHFVLVISASGYPTVYYDGAQIYTDATAAPLAPVAITRIGGYTGSGGENRHSNAILDEVRVSNTVRSANWIKTEYNNQYSPSTFYSVGSEEDNIPPAITIDTPTNIEKVYRKSGELFYVNFT